MRDGAAALCIGKPPMKEAQILLQVYFFIFFGFFLVLYAGWCSSAVYWEAAYERSSDLTPGI
jgi:hypothetical protein